MRATPLLAGVALALGLGACTVPAPPPDAGRPRCDVVMAEGATITGVEMLETICVEPDGTSYLYGTMTSSCLDGRTLVWNDRGWGYIAGPFHVHAAGAEHVAPAAERLTCTP